MKVFLQNQPVTSASQLKNKHFKTWTQQEMVQRFPETMVQCVNPRYEEDTLTTQALERAGEDEDDDSDFEPQNIQGIMIYGER